MHVNNNRQSCCVLVHGRSKAEATFVGTSTLYMRHRTVPKVRITMLYASSIPITCYNMFISCHGVIPFWRWHTCSSPTPVNGKLQRHLTTGSQKGIATQGNNPAHFSQKRRICHFLWKRFQPRVNGKLTVLTLVLEKHPLSRIRGMTRHQVSIMGPRTNRKNWK